MASVGVSIRSVRKRLGETMTDFGTRVGANQSTISKYERGALTPSRSMLLLLLSHAVGDERGPILDALGVEKSQQEGWAPGELEETLGKFERFLDAGGSGKKKMQDMRRTFIEMAMEIAGDETAEVPAWLVHTMQVWLNFKHWDEALAYFDHLPIYLDVQLKAMPEPPAEVRRKMRADQKKRMERK